ncbi:MAG: hypothetical protein ACRC41_07470, partial [Sarcina sp.]
DDPAIDVEVLAIESNDAAIKFINKLDEEKKKLFLEKNILVIKHIAQDISLESLKEVLKEVLSKEDVKEKYVRDFFNCSTIDRNSAQIDLDKIMFVYKYGSKKAKKIAVDEKLRIV